MHEAEIVDELQIDAAHSERHALVERLSAARYALQLLTKIDAWNLEIQHEYFLDQDSMRHGKLMRKEYDLEVEARRSKKKKGKK